MKRILHFGLGAFHRAHQAVWTENVSADWTITAVAPRSRATVDALRAQGNRYAVLTRGPGDPSVRVCHALSETLHLGDDAARVRELMTSPDVRIVTLTITEKGYLADGPVVTAVADGLIARHRAGGAPLTVMSCDNMAANGAVLRAAVRAAMTESVDEDWLDTAVTWPSTVVDRIVPATTPADVEEASALLGFRDEVPVVAEPYRQWVIEDAFAAGRPPWEHDGALIVADVAPYQLTKLRLLNGAHSALAYLGLAAGLGTVADTMATGWGPALVRQLAAEVAPTLPPGGPDPMAYADDLVERFANPGIRHSLRQIAGDGSRKLPERWFGVLRATTSPVLELALAGWVHATHPDRAPDDPLKEPLAGTWDRGPSDIDLVAAQLRLVGAADLPVIRSVAARLPALRAGRIPLTE
ncbi:mannitol dehydrogenase family protein [Actinoplanes sp. G11-F43]|uniref:mannitol dehydrogenase family protein n=1 Tax=Actinoplanes sp. G11-F43 TaxID=3424130 RepID=UPI003D34979C